MCWAPPGSRRKQDSWHGLPGDASQRTRCACACGGGSEGVGRMLPRERGETSGRRTRSDEASQATCREESGSPQEPPNHRTPHAAPVSQRHVTLEGKHRWCLLGSHGCSLQTRENPCEGGVYVRVPQSSAHGAPHGAGTPQGVVSRRLAFWDRDGTSTGMRSQGPNAFPAPGVVCSVLFRLFSCSDVRCRLSSDI